MPGFKRLAATPTLSCQNSEPVKDISLKCRMWSVRVFRVSSCFSCLAYVWSRLSVVVSPILVSLDDVDRSCTFIYIRATVERRDPYTSSLYHPGLPVSTYRLTALPSTYCAPASALPSNSHKTHTVIRPSKRHCCPDRGCPVHNFTCIKHF